MTLYCREVMLVKFYLMMLILNGICQYEGQNAVLIINAIFGTITERDFRKKNPKHRPIYK